MFAGRRFEYMSATLMLKKSATVFWMFSTEI